MKSNISRRGFLKRTLGAAVGAAGIPYIVPSSVLGANGAVLPSERIVMGYIGVGSMGGGHVRQFSGMSEVQAVAVCDVRESNRQRAKNTIDQRYGNKDCATYDDFRELLARKDIDAILNATPDHWHVLISLEAARNRKDMYQEKPLGMSVAEGKALRREIQRTGVVFQFGTQQRSSYNFRFACELARNKRIGELKTIVLGGVGGEERMSPVVEPAPEPVPEGFDYDMWLGPALYEPYCAQRCSRDWMSIHDYCLGAISGAWGIHDVDIAQWAADADNTGPVEIEGKGEWPREGLLNDIDVWDISHTYASGVKMLHKDKRTAREYIKQTGLPALPWMGVLFIGTDGWVFASREALKASRDSLLRAAFGPGDIRLYYSNNHAMNFIDCVKSRKKTICPIESAVRSDAVCHMDDIVVRLGRKLRWDPVKEIFVNDDEANRMLSRAMRSPWHL